MNLVRDREVIANRLAKIANRNGGLLTPDLVVKDAENSKSPLHDLFEWDDGIAGHRYRIEQARQVITSVRVVVTTEHKAISTVYYVRDPSAEHNEQGYVSIDALKSDYELARESIVMEFSRAAAYMQRARIHAEALNMAQEVDALIANVQTFANKIKA